MPKGSGEKVLSVYPSQGVPNLPPYVVNENAIRKIKISPFKTQTTY